MNLLEQRESGILTVRWVRADAIAIGERELGSSFLLAPDRIVEAWPARAVAEIGDEAITAALALEPAVVLLGTGLVQAFPPAAVAAAFLRLGVGLEAMDNPAAARTYNLLAAEGRRVVAAFLLPG